MTRATARKVPERIILASEAECSLGKNSQALLSGQKWANMHTYLHHYGTIYAPGSVLLPACKTTHSSAGHAGLAPS
jgi:hypothetical protein